MLSLALPRAQGAQQICVHCLSNIGSCLRLLSFKEVRNVEVFQKVKWVEESASIWGMGVILLAGKVTPF